MLVMEAYDVKYYQVAGLSSRESQLYDITANVPPGANREQLRLMLQTVGGAIPHDACGKCKRMTSS
jgi:uncharacterized protein (TIGR03435 family)